MDVDRIPALHDTADPDDEQRADAEGWEDLARRYDDLTSREFIRLPQPARRHAVQARRAS